MRLDHDPFAVFEDDLSPCGIYVRHTILGDPSPEVEETRRKILSDLYKSQGEDGSWGSSVTETLRVLHQLLLLEIHPSRNGERAVDWLLADDDIPPKTGRRKPRPFHPLLSRMTSEDRQILQKSRDLVVQKGNSTLTKTAGALFFSGFYNREGDPKVIDGFRELDRQFEETGTGWGTWPNTVNVLLAYGSHPLKKSSRTARTALEGLAGLQKSDGSWEGLPNFYHVYHSVSHSSLPPAVKQFENAFTYLVHNQNADGSWGRSDHKFITCMVLDSLVRRGYANKRQGLKRFMDARKKAPRRPAGKKPEAKDQTPLR